MTEEEVGWPKSVTPWSYHRACTMCRDWAHGKDGELTPFGLYMIADDLDKGVVKIAELKGVVAELIRASDPEWERVLQEHIRRLREMPYSDYLQTEHWQHCRDRALARAQHRCQVCNSTGPLDVHHRTYERRGCEWDEDLTVLCRPCHTRHHDRETAPAPTIEPVPRPPLAEPQEAPSLAPVELLPPPLTVGDAAPAVVEE